MSNMPLTEPPIWLTTAMMAMAIRVKIPYSMAVAPEPSAAKRRTATERRIAGRVGSEGVWPMVLPKLTTDRETRS